MILIATGGDSTPHPPYLPTITLVSTPLIWIQNTLFTSSLDHAGGQQSTGTIVGITVVVIIAVAALVVIIGVVVALLAYGYKNPASTLGQAMIKV